CERDQAPRRGVDLSEILLRRAGPEGVRGGTGRCAGDQGPGERLSLTATATGQSQGGTGYLAVTARLAQVAQDERHVLAHLLQADGRCLCWPHQRDRGRAPDR